MGSRQFIVGVVNQKRLPLSPEPFVPSGPEMIMTWNTTNTSAGSSASNQIDLPLRGDVSYFDPRGGMGYVDIPASDYDFWVDWGDGAGWSTHITTYNDANKLHTYGTSGVKTVKIKGQFGGFYFSDSGDKLKLTDISKFDGMIFDCCLEAFEGCANLNFSATDAPVLALTKSGIMAFMFSGALAFNSNIGNWNVSAATNMYSMFGKYFGSSAFNQNISGWDVSNVTDMGRMFQYCTAFNQNISSWDVSNVNYFDIMFGNATAFNNGGNNGISGWTTSSAVDMSNMFASSAFNQPIGAWNVSNVTGMSYMFSYNNNFNQNIGSWNTSKVTKMNNMFNYNYAFNQNIGSWNVAKVTDMSYMFNANTAFDNGGSPSISGWTTSGVTNMSYMFNGTPFNRNIGAWDVSNVTDMNNMFRATTAFNNGGSPSINNWNTSKVTTMYSMFYMATTFNTPIGNWNVSKVTNFGDMFYGNYVFNQPLSGWTLSTTSNISMSRMFMSATVFNKNIGMWNTAKVTNMQNMFHGARDFNNGGNSSISGWTTSAVTNMSNMFYSNQYFAQYIGSWDVRKVTTMYYMFGRNPGNQPFAFNYSLYNWQPLALTTGSGSGLGNFMYASPTTNNYMSTPLYNQLLINWSGLGSLPNNITAHFGSSKYSGATATTARGVLTGKGWLITDGGAL